jgi:acid phosphatase type 7
MRITIILLVLLLAGCGPGAVEALPEARPEVSATGLPEPTQGATATATVLFTRTATVTATPAPSATVTATATATATPAVLVGAGDVAVCGEPWDDRTADLLDEIEGTIFIAGDAVQDQGAAIEFARCFDPTWGRHKDRIRPAPGNHDYYTPGAQPYYDYFGAAAGEPGKGWYAYRLGEWLVIALNSNCDDVSCKDGSPQVKWLRQTLAENPSQCALAYFHHPRWSSGPAGSSGWMAPFWRALYEGGVDVVISGHDHHYERFAPQDPDGNLDLERGIRQFVVGTGGAYTRGVGEPIANSEVIGEHVFGVLKLELFAGHYQWAFVPAEGIGFTAAGDGTCGGGRERVESRE